MVYILPAYDPDYTDDVSLKFDPPEHGNLTLYHQVKIINLIEQDCSQPWDIRRPLWDKLTRLFSDSVTIPEVSLPNPCGTDFVTCKLAWVVTMFKYRPFEGYFGEDVIKMTAEDGTGYDLFTIKVYVLKNPCMNQGVCEGPETDPNCTSTNRTTGFDGYRCDCPRGYSGDYCETDIDECLSSPCSANYSCVNRVGGYECFCDPKWPCHVTAPLLALWHIVMISAGGGLFLVFLTLVAAWVFCKKLSTKSNRGTSSGSLSSESTIHHGPFRGRWLYGSPSLQQQQQQHINPAFSGDHSLDYRMPDVYGRQNDYQHSPTTNPRPTPLYRKPGPRLPRPKKALFRPIRHPRLAEPFPDYD
ncbi:hypothetical protein LSAT2_032050 [Lamellibrachia satsuma]|nr:hypothetical protein LSAT2_032050 [Lamellibrachia satsuma]